MMKKVIDWVLVISTSVTLICAISIIYIQKRLYFDMYELNPDLQVSALFSNTILSPLGSTAVVVFIAVLLSANIVKEFYLSSIKKRIWLNLGIYLVSVALVAQFFFSVSRF